MLPTILLSLALCPALPHAVPAEGGVDRVTLNDGEVLSGRVVLDGPDAVVLVPARGRGEREIPRSEVREVVSVETTLRQVLDRLDALDAADVGGLLDVADLCDSRGLPGEARSLRLRALLLDPLAERAYQGLGGVQRARGWQVQIERRWVSIDDLRPGRRRWREALEYPTAHFLLRTDLPLERALDLALDLERAYLAFYELFRPSLPLRVFAETPEVRVYAESSAYPRGPYAGDSWFDWEDNIVHVRAPAEAARRPLIYEATRALLRNALYASEGPGGRPAVWAELGLCEVFGAAAEAARGLELGRRSRELYAQHAQSTRDVDLNRVLVASPSETYVGTMAPRLRSRAYTLTDYLLFADEGRHRPGFLRYLVGSFRGQGSRGHFESALGVEVGALERAWETHVAKVVEGP